MEYKELRETIDAIKEALKKGQYKVYYDEPNCIYSCIAPDGRTFYKVVDMDGVKSSNDFGQCTVDVEDYSFTCEWGYGEVESDLYCEIEGDYTLEDGTIVTYAELVKELRSALNEREDIYVGVYSDMDWMAELYAKINNIKDIEYYWCEDPDCPVDIEDEWKEYMPPKKLDYGTVYCNHRKYYIVDEPINKDGEELHAVHCKELPDDKALFKTILVTVKYKKGKMKVVDFEESRDYYNASEGYIE